MPIPASFESVSVGRGRFTISILPIGRQGCEATWSCEHCMTLRKVEGAFLSHGDARETAMEEIRLHHCDATLKRAL
jgi:hypothetical protein